MSAKGMIVRRIRDAIHSRGHGSVVTILACSNQRVPGDRAVEHPDEVDQRQKNSPTGGVQESPQEVPAGLACG